MEAIAPADDERLDAFVARIVPDLDRARAGEWIRAGRVEVVGRSPLKPSLWLRAGDRVRVRPLPPAAAEARPEPLSLPILYADQHLAVVVKPAGMATHPGPGWWSGSAVNALLHHIPHWRPIGGIATPGIVHRLDRDTSGLLLFANGAEAQQRLLADMQARRIERRYLALAQGELAGAGTIDRPLARDALRPDRMAVSADGKTAVTHWRALGSQSGATLLALALDTGRNHQIRVHLADLGHAVVGDPWYGAPTAPDRAAPGGPPAPDDTAPTTSDPPTVAMRLHAYYLAVPHPLTGHRLTFLSMPPWLEWADTREH